MMKKLLKLTAALAMLMIASCSSVSMNKPLPNNTTEEEREGFEGVWSTKEGQCSVKFDSKGLGHVAGLKWDAEKEVFKAEDSVFILTQLDSEFYLSAYQSEGAKGTLVLAKCALVEGDLLIWAPDVGRFKELVKQGELVGEISHNDHSSDVLVKSTPQELAEILKKSKNLFHYKAPNIFTNISK